MPAFELRVRHVFPLILLIAVGVLFGARNAAAEDGYLLALSWEPAFCAGHAARPECKLAAATPPRLGLHGLWPDWDRNGDGKQDGADDFCLSGENNRKAIFALDAEASNAGNWLKLPPVNLSAASSSDLESAMPGTTSGLERHEWWKHGTCSDLKADDYFAIAVALLREVERSSLAHLIAQRAGATIGRAELLAAFESDFGARSARALMLDCEKTADGSALAEIRIRIKRGKVTQGLNADSLDIPAKAIKGDCAADIRIPDRQN